MSRLFCVFFELFFAGIHLFAGTASGEGKGNEGLFFVLVLVLVARCMSLRRRDPDRTYATYATDGVAGKSQTAPKDFGAV